MKKLYILILTTVVAATGAFAQRTVGPNGLPSSYRMEQYALDASRDVTDTLGPAILEGCDLTPALLTANVGWVTGGNDYGDLEKAQYIETTGVGTIYSTLAWIGAKQGGTNETFSAKIYTGDLTDGPSELLGTSNALAYADLDTTGMYTTFSFDTPLAYDSSFFISYEVSNGDAIYGIIHSGGNCGGTSAWELWSDGGGWNDINSAWNGDTDVILYTFAEVETVVVGLDDTNLIERGSQKVFPNPANESAQLVYSLVNPTDIVVRVYTSTGQLVDSYNQGVRNTGLNVLTIDTQEYTQGLYLYTIETENGVRNGKFNVVR